MMKRIWLTCCFLAWLPSCGNAPLTGGDLGLPSGGLAPVLDEVCFLDFGDIEISVQLDDNLFFGVLIPFEGADLIVDDQIIGEIFIDEDRLTVFIDIPFIIEFTDSFDMVLDGEFDGFLVDGSCEPGFFYEGPGTITLVDTFEDIELTFPIFDVAVFPILE